jgi:hypothetical protein
MAESLSVALVALATDVHVGPPLVETSHWSAGAGTPENAAVREADASAFTICETGCVVTDGG